MNTPKMKKSDEDGTLNPDNIGIMWKNVVNAYTGEIPDNNIIVVIETKEIPQHMEPEKNSPWYPYPIKEYMRLSKAKRLTPTLSKFDITIIGEVDEYTQDEEIR